MPRSDGFAGEITLQDSCRVEAHWKVLADDAVIIRRIFISFIAGIRAPIQRVYSRPLGRDKLMHRNCLQVNTGLLRSVCGWSKMSLIAWEMTVGRISVIAINGTRRKGMINKELQLSIYDSFCCDQWHSNNGEVISALQWLYDDSLVKFY